MKRYILSILFTLPVLAVSQTYHPLVEETSLWSVYHYYCKADNNPFSQYVKFQGDVTVNDTVYKQIWFCEDTLTEPWVASGLIREDAQKRVWVRSSSNFPEYLQYDFSALPGDTLWLNDNPYLYVMGDQDSIQLLDGTWRKQFHLIYSNWPDCNEIWIEGIGCLKGVLQSGMCTAVGDDPELICSLSHDTVLYHNQDYSECHLITGVSPPVSSSSVKVYPNPSRGILTVQLPATHGEGIILITDVYGRIIRSFRFTAVQSSATVDLTSLPQGMFLLKVEENLSQAGLLKTLKIILH